MEYVVVETQKDGFWLDPEPYLDVIGGLADGLPAGARRFATDPHHYDFYHERCVKDLMLHEISSGERQAELDLERSGHNERADPRRRGRPRSDVGLTCRGISSCSCDGRH